MTIREFMDRKKRRFALITLAFIGAFLVAGLLAIGLGVAVATPPVVLLCLAGFVAFLIYSKAVAYRCPRCDGPWDGLVMQTGHTLFRVDLRIRYCPFCGTDIDAKDGATPGPEAGELLG